MLNIVEQTQSQLVVKENKTGNFIFGLGFVLFSIALAVMMYLSGTSGIVFLIPLALLLIGLLMLFFWPSFNLTINKNSNQIIYSINRLIGGKTKICSLKDASRVKTKRYWYTEINSNRDSYGNVRYRNTVMERTVLILSSGEELSLDSAHNFSQGKLKAQINDQNTTARRIADFLNVPFEETDPSEPERAFN